MWKKVAIAGAVGAAVLGSGAAALATTGSAAGSGSSEVSAAATDAAGGGRLGALAGRALHATWVTRAPAGAAGYVQHDAIRGTVTAVSATSITVQAVDDVTMTFAVNTATKVHVGKASAIGDVHTDDKVLVVGTGTSALTATNIAGPGALAGGKNRTRA